MSISLRLPASLAHEGSCNSSASPTSITFGDAIRDMYDTGRVELLSVR